MSEAHQTDTPQPVLSLCEGRICLSQELNTAYESYDKLNPGVLEAGREAVAAETGEKAPTKVTGEVKCAVGNCALTAVVDPIGVPLAIGSMNRRVQPCISEVPSVLPRWF